MARFQISSPTIKDQATQTEVRKLATELLAKLNILAQNFKSYADSIAIAFTTQTLTATVAIIRTATIATLNAATSMITTLTVGTINGIAIPGGLPQYPIDTALSFRLPIDDMPELPDNVAGIFYQNDATWTGWTTNNGSSVISSGVVTTTSSANGTFSFASNHAAISQTSPIVVIRIRRNKGSATDFRFYYKSTGNASFRYLQIAVTDSWQTFVVKPTDLAADYMSFWEIDCMTATSGDSFQLSALYIGDGTYKPGTALLDTSPSAFKLTPQAGVVRVPGPTGYAVDTTYGGLYSASEAGLPMSNSPRSGAIYFKSSDTDMGYQQLECYGLVSGSAFFGVYHQGSSFGVENGATAITFAYTGLRNGEWHLLSWSHDGTSISIFCDGVQKAFGALALPTTPSIGISIGHRNGALRFRGQLKPMPIWSRALDAAEVLGLYKDSGTNGPSIPATGSGPVVNANNPVFTGYNSFLMGTAVASVAGVITPTGPIFHVTGALAITGINIPYTGFVGTVTIIPDGAFTWTAATNIALAGTAVVNKAIIFTYDSTAVKWYPSYV